MCEEREDGHVTITETVKSQYRIQSSRRAAPMSNNKVTFHEPVDPATRYKEEMKSGAEHPISYNAESRAGDWQVEKDGTANLDDQMRKGDEAGMKARNDREAEDEDYKPST